MPTIVVAAGASPRNLSAVASGYDLCQASPDGTNSCPPSAWVNVVVWPIGTVTPDSAGQLLHPAFRFAAPKTDEGKRRAPQMLAPLSNLPPTTAARTELIVETDPGCYWIGTPADIIFMGGTPGDSYDVSIQFTCIKQKRDACTNVDVMEPAFRFALTSYFFLLNEPGVYAPFPHPWPQYHTHFEVVQGSALISIGAGNQVPLDSSYGPAGKIPLNLVSNAAISVATGIYRTSGAF